MRWPFHFARRNCAGIESASVEDGRGAEAGFRRALLAAAGAARACKRGRGLQGQFPKRRAPRWRSAFAGGYTQLQTPGVTRRRLTGAVACVRDEPSALFYRIAFCRAPPRRPTLAGIAQPPRGAAGQAAPRPRNAKRTFMAIPAEIPRVRSSHDCTSARPQQQSEISRHPDTNGLNRRELRP